MREFKNSKARELFLQSLKLDDEVRKMEQEDIKNYGTVFDFTLELGTEAAGLRVLADDIEDGIIDEEEIEI